MTDLELWAFLIPILISDVINPVLLAAVVYALGTPRPYLISFSVVAGHTVTYFVGGVLAGIGFEHIIEYVKDPNPIDFAIELVIGLVLFVVGILVIRANRQQQAKEFRGSERFGPGLGFVTGMTINLVGLPFAVPYFGVLAQIIKADLSLVEALLVLTIYNLLYALPFVGVIGLQWRLGDQSQPILERLNAWMGKASTVLLPILLIGIGSAAMADACAYFLRGKPLF